MKKLFIFMLAIMVIGFCMPIANASDTESIEHYSVTNGSASADLITYVSATTVIKGKHRILGFLVSPILSGSGSNVGGLYDATASDEITSANLLGEKGGVNTTSFDYTFPGPIDITKGLAVSQGYGTTVTIYYERSRP